MADSIDSQRISALRHALLSDETPSADVLQTESSIGKAIVREENKESHPSNSAPTPRQTDAPFIPATPSQSQGAVSKETASAARVGARTRSKRLTSSANESQRPSNTVLEGRKSSPKLENRRHAIPNVAPSSSSPNIGHPPSHGHSSSHKKMYHSFAGPVGGDTQPDSQLYSRYLSMRHPPPPPGGNTTITNTTDSLKRPQRTSNALSVSSNDSSDNDSDMDPDTTNSKHQNSLRVDLLGAWEANQRRRSTTTKSPQPDAPTNNYDDDEISPVTQYLHPPSRSLTALNAPPETPQPPSSAMRNHAGEFLITPASKTPATLARLFLNGDGSARRGPAGMSLTQAFDATQAGSSPGLRERELRSDPVFERPSPEFGNMGRDISVGVGESSPIKMRGRGRGRDMLDEEEREAGGESQDGDMQQLLLRAKDSGQEERYLTMKESQELRARRLRALQEANAGVRMKGEDLVSSDYGPPDEEAHEDDSDGLDGFVTMEEERVRKQRMRAEIDEQALSKLAGVSAPSRTERGRRGRKPSAKAKANAVVDRSSQSSRLTPLQKRKQQKQKKEVVEVSDDESEDLASDADEPSDADSLDVLEASPETTPKKGGRILQKSARAMSYAAFLKPIPTSSGVLAVNGGGARINGYDYSAAVTSHEKVVLHEDAPGNMDSSRQSVAVANSQPEGAGTSQKEKLVEGRINPSSVDSNRVVQSQFTPPSSGSQTRNQRGSRNKAQSKASQPDELRRSSSKDHTELDRMPSSPPVAPGTQADEADDPPIVTGNGVSSSGRAVSQSFNGLATPREKRWRKSQGLEGTTPAAFHTGGASTEGQDALQTIPETDPVDPPYSSSKHPPSSRTSSALQLPSKLPPTTPSAQPSNGTSVYQTARSRASESNQEEPRHSSGSVHDPLDSQDRRTPRKLTDIAAEQPSQASVADLGAEINIMTDEDYAFAELVKAASPQQPARKRRKVYGGQGRGVTEGARVNGGLGTVTPRSVGGKGRRGSLEEKSQEQLNGAAQSMSAKELEERGPEDRNKDLVEGATAKTRTSSMPPPTHVQTHETKEIAETPQTKATRQLAQLRSKSGAWKEKKVAKRPTAKGATAVSKSKTEVDAAEKPLITNGQKFDGSIVAPNRVLALFRGNTMNYYPATCISVLNPAATRFRVRFDDNTESELESNFVRALDFELGDPVKVDLPGMRTKTYLVRSFKQSQQEPDAPKTEPKTDRKGNDTLILSEKGRNNPIDVALTSIYITGTLWTRFKDRTYLPISPSSNGLAQPNNNNNNGASTPTYGRAAPGTPSSRSRRRTANSGAVPDALSATTSVRSGSGALGGLFAGMAFAITWGPNEEEKSTIANLLDAHGAQILHSGFNELFDIPADLPDPTTANATTTTPTAEVSNVATNTAISLPLRPSSLTLGFTALLADSHSRRIKHMEALALGLPILHGRWVSDCVRANRVLPWAKYLLPAGVSDFLDGAVRSLTLVPYDPSKEQARLRDVLDRRPVLLRGDGVLVVQRGSGGSGKAAKSKMKKGKRVPVTVDSQARALGKHYAFLTRAMGAGRIAAVSGLDDARKTLAEARPGTWKWVYVDGDVHAARGVLFGGAVEGNGSTEDDGVVRAGKKRKRGAEGDSEREGKGESGFAARDEASGVVVVGSEFVLQSLILGALLEG